ncbi:tubulin epsilon and delta complex protein 1 isoform X2 [Rhineura floridana]|uniref:tubulin epsilon and delta complex protein 1 isoform X2 n=1 Tax=Rhineura floridana TaxID=261503 RepID=UPI002AC80CB8|nr:tubulin epsilon and delta complex protein 1 isoform X2 [Rhineura floridana]
MRSSCSFPVMRNSSTLRLSGSARRTGAIIMDSRRTAAAVLPVAIGALSMVLPGPRISSETFRLAKFDQPHVSKVFWKLLYSLLKQIQGGGWMEPADTGTQVRFVKSVALSHGYRRLAFYQLPSDGSEGSRELLLVFSWLLCRISIMEQLLTLSRVKLWDEAIVCMCDAPLKSLQDEESLAPKSHVKGQRDVRYLQWLNGHLQFWWRNCHTEQQEQCTLLHKVHSYTIGSHTDSIIGHFSVTEADVVRRPDNYKQLLQFIESCSCRLEAFLKWKPLEPVYWHWMETLLDPSTENANPHKTCNKDSILPSADLYCYDINRTIKELDRCRKDLLTLRDGLDELIAYKKLSCHGKVRTREQKQLGEREFCRAVKKVEEVVELKLSDLKCHSSDSRTNTMHGPYRLVFKRKHLKASKMIRSAEPQEPIVEGIALTDVICDLRKKEARLEAELKERQEGGRKKVYEAAEGLGQVLFIPPMKRQETRNAD